MCSSIYIEGKRCSTLGDLRSLIGKANVVYCKGYKRSGDEFCLCSVDKEATAKNTGHKTIYTGVDWFFVKRGNTTYVWTGTRSCSYVEVANDE